MLEAHDLGNEDAGLPKEQSPGKPTTRYSAEEKAAAVRMVRALRPEAAASPMDACYATGAGWSAEWLHEKYRFNNRFGRLPVLFQDFDTGMTGGRYLHIIGECSPAYVFASVF
jgi:hypothetical protein